MAGQAQLAEAEGNRQIAVRAAMAKRDSAKMEADAAIIRAKGVAEANRIVAQGLGGPEGYLRSLYINNLENPKRKIIYVPNDAGLPILEAAPPSQTHRSHRLEVRRVGNECGCTGRC